MDKSWIHLKNRLDPAYKQGAEKFIEFAYANKPHGSKIYCPCRKCLNLRYQTRDGIREHIIIHGFDTNYMRWTIHGELLPPSNRNEMDVNQGLDSMDDMVGMVHDTFGVPRRYGGSGDYQVPDPENIAMGMGPDEQTKKFFKLLNDAERELYPGCVMFTTLSFIVQLLHIKVLNGWTDKSFDMLLKLLKKAFPKGETLPESYYKAKKFNDSLGFTYNKYDACPQDCMLFWKEKKGLDKCDVCGSSRYKDSEVLSPDGTKKITRIAAKQVRHLPLIPRLQRRYMNSKTASLMKWHAEERIDDGKSRHPADSLAWKSFDEKHPNFASDSRNVRLGLAADGFNPFRTMSIAHSTWPVVLMTYNLPPWLCMKQPYFILSLLIDGPRSPGNKIDVYLQPLIEELMELWVEGVLTYDAASNQMFRMYAALLWTIHDFPGYAILSGWSTKGALACPICNKDTCSLWLKYSRKHCYMGHRRFLDQGHKFRKDAISFDGTIETEPMPHQLTGDDVLKQLESIENEYGERAYLPNKRRRVVQEGRNSTTEKRLESNWRKKSIFFQLPYWKDNLIRHILDVMHIEKNFLENIIWTLLNILGKTKDNLKSRRDLQYLHIRKALHPQLRQNGKVFLPPACFTLSSADKDIFCKVLKNVKVPDGYSSNISRRVQLKERTILGLKSHDCHILMQQLLPLAVRRALPKNVCEALIELSNFFRHLCSKVLHPNDFGNLEAQIRLTLCHLEKIFPPSFFDIMEHLPIHLAEEARIAGPVHYRWMYSIERYLLTLKKYVRNRSHPEGSIVEGYLAEECLTFCSLYLHDVESKLNRPIRNYEGEGGRGLGKMKLILLDQIACEQAHRYVLANSNAVTPYREKHIQVLKLGRSRLSERDLMRKHNEQFPEWFRDHVQQLQRAGNVDVSEEIKMLSVAPDNWARSYTGYIINGFRFHTKQREERRKTQNSGVSLTATTQSYASSRDRRPITGEVTFYGVLTDIFELRYSNNVKFVLFKCDWVDNNVGKKQDEFKFTLVNFKHLMYKQNRISDEPFILASQAEQVWYVQDPVEEDWHVVVKMTPRDLYDIPGKEAVEDEITCPQVEPYSCQQLDDTIYTHEEEVNWVRSDVDGTTIDLDANDDGSGDEYNADMDISDDEEDFDIDYDDESEDIYTDEDNDRSGDADDENDDEDSDDEDDDDNDDN